jgi:hypothetical protein
MLVSLPKNTLFFFFSSSTTLYGSGSATQTLLLIMVIVPTWILMASALSWPLLFWDSYYFQGALFWISIFCGEFGYRGKLPLSFSVILIFWHYHISLVNEVSFGPSHRTRLASKYFRLTWCGCSSKHTFLYHLTFPLYASFFLVSQGHPTRM